MLGLIGKTGEASANNISNGSLNPPNNSNAQPTPVAISVKNEMVQIPGGKFLMGRNDGAPQEQPAHSVEVKDFWMDKTEVTNAEYEKFVQDVGYSKFPANWVNGKPVVGEEMFPVVRVNIEDVKAFIEWRSKRDNVQYRLPTEKEWEFAARNGEANNLYPWGDAWEERRAILEQSAPKPVGSATNGANKWGVYDLIGNVWEWTESDYKSYPGSAGEIIKKNKTPEYVIRGGGFVSRASGDKAVTSTTRLGVEITRQDGVLGFRLVR
jgi:formylglycine-generating enzyme required for sulfatase activity